MGILVRSDRTYAGGSLDHCERWNARDSLLYADSRSEEGSREGPDWMNAGDIPELSEESWRWSLGFQRGGPDSRGDECGHWAIQTREAWLLTGEQGSHVTQGKRRGRPQVMNGRGSWTPGVLDSQLHAQSALALADGPGRRCA